MPTAVYLVMGQIRTDIVYVKSLRRHRDIQVTRIVQNVSGQIGVLVSSGIGVIRGNGYRLVDDSVQFLTYEKMVVPLEENRHAMFHHELVQG